MLRIFGTIGLIFVTGSTQAGWDTSGLEDKLTGRRTPALILDAVETEIFPVGFPATHHYTAFLLISCTDKKTLVGVSVAGRPTAQRGSTISYRLDQAPPAVRQRWVPMISGEGMSLLDRKRATATIENIARASTMFVRIEDDALGRTEATFKLDGIEEAIKPLRQECHF